MSRLARLAAALVLAALGVAACREPPPPGPVAAAGQATPDAAGEAARAAALDVIEEATEAFVHRLHDVSEALRAAEPAALRPLLAETVRLALPEPDADLRPLWRWVLRREWSATEARGLSRDEAAAALAALARRFASREDVGFDVTESRVVSSDPDVTGLEARFRAFVVGRDRSGRREWLRCEGRVAGARHGDAWEVTELAFESAGSLVASRDLFADVSEEAGVAHEDPSFAERGYRGLLAHGAAAADVDGDGLVDVFTTSLERNFLYLNQGDGTFREAAVEAGLAALPRPGVAPLFVDVDDDGDRDLFVSALGPQVLLENRLVPDGRLLFRDVSRQAGVDRTAQGFSVAAGDLDGDGRVDLYVASYGPYGEVMPDTWDGAGNGTPNLAFLNLGDGTFREAAVELGLDDPRWTYAALIADLDGDSAQEVLTGNDFGGPNGVFVRRGERFVDEAVERGLGVHGFAMGLSLGDPDADGDLDLHVTKMSSVAGSRILRRFAPGELPARDALSLLKSGNALYENLGDGTFRDVTATAGPFRGGWCWGGGFIDLDGDGLDDVHVPAGFASGAGVGDTDSLYWRQVVASTRPGGQLMDEFIRRQVALLLTGHSFTGHQRDLVAVNQADGTFLDISGVSGLDSLGDGRAAVYADFDDDGDLDVFLRSMHGPGHLLFANLVGQGEPSVRVALEGRASGRDAFGAVVRVATSRGVVARIKAGGSGFLAQGDPRLLFGLGGGETALWLEVDWPSGLRQRFPGPPAGASVRVIEGDDAWRPVEERPFRLPVPHLTTAAFREAGGPRPPR